MILPNEHTDQSIFIGKVSVLPKQKAFRHEEARLKADRIDESRREREGEAIEYSYEHDQRVSYIPEKDTPPLLTCPCPHQKRKQATYQSKSAINQDHHHILRLALRDIERERGRERGRKGCANEPQTLSTISA